MTGSSIVSPAEPDYRERGYLIVEDVLTPTAISALLQAGMAQLAIDRPQRILDSSSGQVRVLFDIHNLDPLFGQLVNDAWLVGLARQLLDGEPYVLQTQLNPKAPFDEVSWDWHTDFGFWHTRDGMKAPDVLTVLVLLEDSTEANGPVIVVPGSHRENLPGHTAPLEDHLPGDKESRYHLDEDAIQKLTEQYGTHVLTAAAGSIIVFDGRVVHCSTANASRHGRMAMLIRYNRVENALPEISRPRADWKVARSVRLLSPTSTGLVRNL